LESEYSILEATDGVDGVVKAEKNIPDLIICDVMMPKKDGITVCKELKINQKTSHIPIVLLTAKANLESKIEGLETGADDYVTKPFNAVELKARVNNLILQRQQLRARFSKTLILQPKDIAITSADEQFLERAMKVIEEHMDNSDFNMEVFQQEVGMSRMQLHRKLKALTDTSASEFIRIQRLKRAAQLLQKNGSSISEVCYNVGFSSLSYFTKCFKEQFGVVPSQYTENKNSS
jgi:DNA-binding response OmpR family regulator